MPTLTEQGEELLPYVAKFGKQMIKSNDLDPLYPILRYMVRDMAEEEALWFTFLYVAWYNLPSGMLAYQAYMIPPPELIQPFPSHWPTGIERRNNRGGKVNDHIKSFLHATYEGDLIDWFTEGLTPSRGDIAGKEANWRILNERLQSIHGNGRWAAYKHCEVLRRVHDLDIIAPDMGMRYSSGPREGLAILYGEVEGQGEAAVAVLDDQGVDLQRRLADLGLDVDIEELETILCNFKSLYKGKYYTGHDHDELQEQIEKAVEKGWFPDYMADAIWEARKATLPHEYLGELNGWSGVQKKRMIAFKERRKIAIRRPRE